MSLIEEVLAEIDDKHIDDFCVGCKYAGVKIGERIGVAHTGFYDDTCNSPLAAGKLIGAKIAGLALSANLLEATLGTAAINAQLEPQDVTMGLNIFDKIIEIAPGYKKIGIVGGFPFIRKLPSEKLYKFEKQKIEGFLPASKAEELLPECDLVVITGSAFANHTLERFLDISTGHTMVIGPTTPLSKVLFDHGADLLAGIMAYDERILKIIGRGQGTRDFIGLAQTVVMQKG